MRHTESTPAISETAPTDLDGSDDLSLKQGLFVVFVLALALLIVGVVHSLNARTQFLAGSYPQVLGRMTHYEWDDFGSAGETQLLIEYHYAVNGRRYFGDRKRFAWRHFRSESPAAAALAKSWGTGKQVKVFYDPEDPGQAALDNLFTPGDWKTLGCAMAAILIGAVILGLLIFEVSRTLKSNLLLEYTRSENGCH